MIFYRKSLLGSGRGGGGTLAARATCRLGGGRHVERLGWARRTAFHDVLDLVGVNRFPFHERFPHRLALVAAGFDDFSRYPILLVAYSPDLCVPLPHRPLPHI